MRYKRKWELVKYNTEHMISVQKQHRQESLRRIRRHSGTRSYIRHLREVCIVSFCVLAVCVTSH